MAIARLSKSCSGVKPLSDMRAEQPRSLPGWGRVMPAGALIGLAGGDGANEKLQVEMVLDQTLGAKFVEQFGMAGRIVFAEVVHRVDDAQAEEVAPHAVGGGPGEEGVVAAQSSSRPARRARRRYRPSISVPCRRGSGPEPSCRCLGIMISRFMGSSVACEKTPALRCCGSMPEKKAANSQNCLRLHSAKGWSWHWAHSSLMPRNSRDVAAARFSGFISLAW